MSVLTNFWFINRDAGNTLLYQRKFYQSQVRRYHMYLFFMYRIYWFHSHAQDCLQRAMNTFFEEQKNEMLQKLKKSRTVDAARKIAVFKTIQRQVGLRGLPSIPDVTCFFLSCFSPMKITLFSFFHRQIQHYPWVWTPENCQLQNRSIFKWNCSRDSKQFYRGNHCSQLESLCRIRAEH